MDLCKLAHVNKNDSKPLHFIETHCIIVDVLNENTCDENNEHRFRVN